jgi:hypothetical protein
MSLGAELAAIDASASEPREKGPAVNEGLLAMLAELGVRVVGSYAAAQKVADRANAELRGGSR